jgi:hypothetical protein
MRRANKQNHSCIALDLLPAVNNERQKTTKGPLLFRCSRNIPSANGGFLSLFALSAPAFAQSTDQVRQLGRLSSPNPASSGSFIASRLWSHVNAPWLDESDRITIKPTLHACIVYASAVVWLGHACGLTTAWANRIRPELTRRLAGFVLYRFRSIDHKELGSWPECTI